MAESKFQVCGLILRVLLLQAPGEWVSDHRRSPQDFREATSWGTLSRAMGAAGEFGVRNTLERDVICKQ